MSANKKKSPEKTNLSAWFETWWQTLRNNNMSSKKNSIFRGYEHVANQRKHKSRKLWRHAIRHSGPRVKIAPGPPSFNPGLVLCSVSLQFTCVRSFVCLQRQVATVCAYCSTVGLYCATITWKRICKCSLYVTVVGRVAILAKLSADHGNLSNFKSVWLQIFWFGYLEIFGDFLKAFVYNIFGLAKCSQDRKSVV